MSAIGERVMLGDLDWRIVRPSKAPCCLALYIIIELSIERRRERLCHACHMYVVHCNKPVICQARLSHRLVGSLICLALEPARTPLTLSTNPKGCQAFKWPPAPDDGILYRPSFTFGTSPGIRALWALSDILAWESWQWNRRLEDWSFHSTFGRDFTT